MNADALKGKIKGHAMTQSDVADAIGISLSRFNAKINNCGAEFTLGEVRAIRDVLCLTPEETDFIFFS